MAATVIQLGSGSLKRELASKEMVHTSSSVDTHDRQDHTFAGIMWDVKARSYMPIEYLEINSVYVRGELGPMTVWVTDNTFQRKHESQEDWTLVHEQVHPASHRTLRELQFTAPVRLAPGESIGVYVHSKTEGDSQIVYDNQSRTRELSRCKDQFIEILPGMAHLCNQPFSRFGTEGMHWWGSPWRTNREFVGRVSYGVRWLLWNPHVNSRLPKAFREMVWSILMTRHRRAHASFLYHLETEMLYFILNKVNWWEMGDKSDSDWVPPGWLIARETEKQAPEEVDATGDRWAHRYMFYNELFHHVGDGDEDDDDDDDDNDEDDDDEDYVPPGAARVCAAHDEDDEADEEAGEEADEEAEGLDASQEEIPCSSGGMCG